MVTSTRDVIVCVSRCSASTSKDKENKECESIEKEKEKTIELTFEETRFLSSVLCLHNELESRRDREMNLDPLLSAVLPDLISSLREEERKLDQSSHEEEEDFEWVEEERFHKLQFFHNSCKEDLEYLYRITSQYLTDHESNIDCHVIRMCLNGMNRAEKNQILTTSPFLISYFERNMLEIQNMDDFMDYERWTRVY